MESRNITMSRGKVLKMGSKSVKLLIVSSSIARPRLSPSQLLLAQVRTTLHDTSEVT